MNANEMFLNSAVAEIELIHKQYQFEDSVIQ